ncbi:MAG: PfkB family carbohydrate kinase [Pseudomonadota bacterium]|nr:PfkB family carbohydrate kinase [Pseudomonadota bacterium]
MTDEQDAGAAPRLPCAPARVFVLGNYVQACCWRVPRLPQTGETLAAQGFGAEPGGKGLNVAVGMQRLGLAVDTLIGCGRDAAGDALLALLAREGIGTRHVHRFDGPSGWGAGLIGPQGENMIAVFAGANAALGPAHVAAAQPTLQAAQLVYGQLETSLSAVQAAFACAHAAGVMTVLNLSPWGELPARLRQCTHTLIVNQTEGAALLGLPAAALAGHASASARHALLRLGHLRADWPALRRLVLTLGAQGSAGMEWQGAAAPQAWHAPAWRVRAVDTVGAGDAFASGYGAAVLAGRGLAEALCWGNLCGAHMVKRRGVLAALPGRDWLHARLRQAGAHAACAVGSL